MDHQVDENMELAKSREFDELVTSVFEYLSASFPVAVNLDASAAGFEVVGGQKSVDTGLGINELIDVDPSGTRSFLQIAYVG